MGNVLIIDDDEMMCKAMSALIKQMGHDVTYALNLNDGLGQALAKAFDVVFLDVRMPDGNGLDLLPKIKGTSSGPEVIIITASGDPDGAELAIRSGAWDYIEKTSSIKEMLLPLTRALQYQRDKLSRMPPVALKRERIIGSSPKMKACFDQMAQAAVGDANVLITGETGTGKELFALAIHDNSPRADRDFVVVDCAALPKTLVESVLFGHEKGVFTGADSAQEGLIKQADGGVLFLDEVGELPMVTQRAFLRVLHERHFRPIGAKKEIESNFRLIAATNRDLDQMMESGAFRKDLLYRLRSLTIELPPLRERPEDIKGLARYHVTRLCDRYGTETKGFSPEFFDVLESYYWPGNVRELVNTLDAALAKAGGDPVLFSKHLPIQIRVRKTRASISRDESGTGPLKGGADPACVKESADPAGALPTLRDFRKTLEKQYLQDLILLTGHDIKKVCRISGLSRSRLYELLAKYTISLQG